VAESGWTFTPAKNRAVESEDARWVGLVVAVIGILTWPSKPFSVKGEESDVANTEIHRPSWGAFLKTRKINNNLT
jgi:hypothetical protein